MFDKLAELGEKLENLFLLCMDDLGITKLTEWLNKKLQ